MSQNFVYTEVFLFPSLDIFVCVRIYVCIYMYMSSAHLPAHRSLEATAVFSLNSLVPPGLIPLTSDDVVDKLDSVTEATNMNLTELQEAVEDRRAWRALVHRVTKSQTRLNNYDDSLLLGSWLLFLKSLPYKFFTVHACLGRNGYSNH